MAITIQTILNAQQDLQTIETIVNGPAANVALRTGGSVKSLAKVIAELEGSGASLYGTTTEGIANTSNGQYFQVRGAGDTFSELYLNNNGVAVNQNASLPSKQFVDNVAAVAIPLVVTLTDATLAGDANLDSYTRQNTQVTLNPVGNSRTISNLPSGATAPAAEAIMTVLAYGENTLQTYYQTDGRRWQRKATGDVPPTFTPWVEISDFREIDIVTATSAGSRDLNVYTTPNTYITFTAAVISNTPQGTVTLNNARCDVLRSGSGVKQELVLENGSRYERAYANAVFGPWVDLSAVDLGEIDASALGAGARSFATLLSTSDAYTFDGSTTIVDGPAGNALYSGTLVNVASGKEVEQNFYQDNVSPPWRRAVVGGAISGNWFRVVPSLVGSRIMVLGDSIVAGVGAVNGGDEGFPTVLGQVCGGYVAMNGVAGAQMSPNTAPDQTKIDGSFPNVAANAGLALNTYDTVIVSYGTNDFNRGQTIGTITDTTTVTFYGAMRVGYEALLAANPDMRVVFMQPLYRAISAADPLEDLGSKQGSGVVMKDYRDALIAFCDKFKLELIDSYGELGVNELTAPTLLNDGLHPTTGGHKRLGKLVGRKLIG